MRLPAFCFLFSSVIASVSEAIQLFTVPLWIASSLPLLAMTAANPWRLSHSHANAARERKCLRFHPVRERGRTVGQRSKKKIAPEQYKARFAAEKVLQERRYCNVFKLWRTCRLKSCRRNEACGGNQHACLKRALDRVPRLVQWQARQDILIATPRNVGGPERAARQCMPRDFYE